MAVLDYSIPENSWAKLLTKFTHSDTFLSIQEKINAQTSSVFPLKPFKAFELTELANTKVVILGQDPYHTPQKAMGLAFSVPNEEKIPPSLRNIFKELNSEYGVLRKENDLSDWAKSGVLLLNATLTVTEGKPLSHAKFGWNKLVDEVIIEVAKKGKVVFLLWGKDAKAKKSLIEKNRGDSVLILESNHPSPLSATRPPEPFLGNNHFKKANEFLVSLGLSPINWIGKANQETLF